MAKKTAKKKATATKTRLRALVGLNYPTPQSLAIVNQAGGLSKLTTEQRTKVKNKRVEAGGWCDDVPASALPYLLQARQVEEVEVEEKTIQVAGEVT